MLAEPDHRVLLLCAQEQDHRGRAERRRRGDPDHVRGRGAARLRPAEETRRPGRHGKCRAGCEFSEAAADAGEGGVTSSSSGPSVIARSEATKQSTLFFLLDCFASLAMTD